MFGLFKREHEYGKISKQYNVRLNHAIMPLSPALHAWTNGKQESGKIVVYYSPRAREWEWCGFRPMVGDGITLRMDGGDKSVACRIIEITDQQGTTPIYDDDPWPNAPIPKVRLVLEVLDLEEQLPIDEKISRLKTIGTLSEEFLAKREDYLRRQRVLDGAKKSELEQLDPLGVLYLDIGDKYRERLEEIDAIIKERWRWAKYGGTL